MSTVKDAIDSLANAQAELAKLAQFFCPAWDGYKAWKDDFNQVQTDLNKEAQAISVAQSDLSPGEYDWYLYDTSTIDQINLRLMSLDLRVQTASGLCKAVAPGTTQGIPGQTPGSQPGQQQPPPGMSGTTAALIAIGVGVAIFGGYWVIRGYRGT